MQKVKISPSLMCANLLDLQGDLEIFQKMNIDYLHIDIMDGHYVPNFTLGIDFCKTVASYSEIPLDLHLMIENVDKYIPRFAQFGNAIICIHPEVSYHPIRSVQLIRYHGAKAGIAIELTSGIDVEVQVHGTILLKCVNQTIDKLRATLSSHPEIKVAKDRIESFRREMLYKNLSLSRGLLHFRHVDEDSQVFLDKRRSFWKDFASFVSNTQYDGSEETQNMIFKESCAVDPELVEDLLDKDPDYDKDLMQVDHESLFEATIHIREKLGARLFDPIKTEFAQSLMAIILVLAGNDDQQIDASHRPLN